MNEKKKIKKPLTIIIIIISVFGIMLLIHTTRTLSTIIKESKERGPIPIANKETSVQAENLSEVTDKDIEGLEDYYTYSISSLDRYEFDEKGNIISVAQLGDENAEIETMTDEELEEGCKEALTKIENKSKDIPILGTWTLLDTNGKLAEGNYIKFNADGTYERRAKSNNIETILKGKYMYAPSVFNLSTRQRERKSRGFYWYYVIMNATEMIENGEKVREGNEFKEAILGIGEKNNRQMVQEGNNKYAFIKTAN